MATSTYSYPDLIDQPNNEGFLAWHNTTTEWQLELCGLVTDTDHSAPKDADGEMYEGIEAPDSLVDGTVNWDQLKQSTSPEKVQGVIITGID